MNWNKLSQRILEGGDPISKDEALAVLNSSDDELLELLQAAYQIRKKHYGKAVSLHVLQNVKSGVCPEDCSFCSQSSTSTSDIEKYQMQSVEEIVASAQNAIDRDALRYCMVASSRGPSEDELDTICTATEQIKEKHPKLEICVSMGFLTEEKARRLKDSGVNRFNHNLETSERFYPEICGTHLHADRVDTARTVKEVGMDLCCGGLIGMGETFDDRIELAYTLKELDVDSAPLNFLDPREGTDLGGQDRLTPNDCLRTLCMFRLVLTKAEIRIAGGRESCLRTLQPLALYPANSMFTNGYLTTDGQDIDADRAMVEDAGFTIGNVVNV